jgi:hypothetical protein
LNCPAFIGGPDCNAGSGANSRADRGAFAASEKRAKSSTNGGANSGGLPGLFAFTMSAIAHHLAGSRITAIAEQNVIQGQR